MCKRYRTILISCSFLMTVGLVVALSPKCLVSGHGDQGVFSTAMADDDGDHRYGGDGYDEEGRDRKGYDRDGYDRKGYSSKDHDREGYDHDGYRDDGHHRDGHYKASHDRRNKQGAAGVTSGDPLAPTYSSKPVVKQY